MRAGVLVGLVLATTAGCSSSGGDANGTVNTTPDGAVDGARPLSVEAGGSESAGDSGVPAWATTTVTAAIGPIAVAANQEKTVCITKRLGNDGDLVVSAITASLAPGSHHLIVYRVTDTQENLTPTPCMPFLGLAAGQASPIALINRDQFLATLPKGVGLKVAKNQMARIEAHYINTTTSALEGNGSVTFHGVPAASSPAWQAADFAFWGTTKINIPAHSTATVGPLFQAGVQGTHLISLSTHQHSLGTGIKVWASAQTGDLSDLLTNQTQWSDPAWQPLNPPIDFNGTNGLSYQCSWDNTTSHDVSFGESALDEMCFVGGFYYPSNGFDPCIDQSCTHRTAGDAGTGQPSDVDAAPGTGDASAVASDASVPDASTGD